MSARKSIIPGVVPHLGCPNNCVFCNQRRISGSQKPANAQTVKDSIEQAAALPLNGAKRQLAFYGGSFTAIPVEQQTALLDAAKEYMDRGVLHSIRLSTRPDAIDDEVGAIVGGEFLHPITEQIRLGHPEHGQRQHQCCSRCGQHQDRRSHERP